MKSNILKIAVAALLAKFLSGLIINGSFIQIFVLFAGFLFFFLFPLRLKFIILSFAAFYPLIFNGNFKYISDPKWIIMISPVLFIIIMIELISNKQKLYAGGAGWFFTAVGILTIWTIVNYIRQPVLGQQLAAVSTEQGGLRAYVQIIVGVATFLSCYWYVRVEEIDIDKFLIVILWFSLIVGLLRFITFFFDYYLPFFGEAFRHHVYSSINPDSLRIHGISEAGILGIAITISLTHGKKWSVLYLIASIIFLSLIVLSGGRSTFIGFVLSILLYVFLVQRKYLIPVVLILSVMSLAYVSFDISSSESKFLRIIQVTDKDLEKEEGRKFNYLEAVDIFMQSPVFGKGINYMEATQTSKTYKRIKEHLTQQFTTGGHGSYTSMMMIFGIGGIFFIVVMVFGGIIASFKIIRNKEIDEKYSRFAVFVFVYLIILSIDFIPHEQGYTDMRLWFVTGMLSGIKSKIYMMKHKTFYNPKYLT